MMRAVRGLLGIVLTITIVVMALYLARLPVASMIARSAMAGAGFENPQLRVTALSLGAVQLKTLAIGPRGKETIDIENVNVTFDWRTLLFDRRVTAVTAGPGTVRAVLAPDGSASLPGIALGGGASGGALPLDRLLLQDLTLLLDAPEGSARGTLSAAYDVKTGGRGTIELAAQAAGYRSLRVENGALRIVGDLESSGAVKIEGVFAGDVFSQLGPVRNLDLAFTATGASWREVVEGRREALTGEATVELRSAALRPGENELLSAVNIGDGVFLFGRRVSEITLDGRLLASLQNGRVEFIIPQQEALSARTDTGAILAITPREDKPLLLLQGQDTQIAFDHAVHGALLTAVGSFEAEKTGGVWSFRAPAKIGDYRSDAIAVANSAFTIDGVTSVTGVTVDISLTTALEKLSVGRLDVFDAPVEATIKLIIDNAAKTLTLNLAQGDCINVKKARFVIEEEDADAALSNGRLCASDGPLAVIDWSGVLRCTLNGELTASNARYRLGQTGVRGRPPKINFDAAYEPEQNTTRVSGGLEGGRMIVNEALLVSAASGNFELVLDKDMMTGAVKIKRSTIASTEETPLVAPVRASGEARLVDRDMIFSFSLATPDGGHLGRGRGRHNVETARGEASLDFARLEFLTGGLQPETLAPVLRGIVGRTTGAVAGSTQFSWAPPPAEPGSSASFRFDNLTFQGPGITVTQTAGVTGDVRLSSLWPVATDGVQTISIGRIDLAALQLENGTVQFELPGDETLRVNEATFPWFGGVLGVYGVSASMTGGEAVARFEAKDADLSLMLDFIDVEGLSGEGVLSGVLPLVIEEGKARIEGGVLSSNGSGAIRYTGQASDAAAGAGEEAGIAFGILRNLQFNSLIVHISGPLDGRIDFNMVFEGVGDVPVNRQNVTVPVIYRINLEAALLDLLNQVNVSRNIEMQIERALEGE